MLGPGLGACGACRPLADGLPFRCVLGDLLMDRSTGKTAPLRLRSFSHSSRSSREHAKAPRFRPRRIERPRNPGIRRSNPSVASAFALTRSERRPGRFSRLLAALQFLVKGGREAGGIAAI